jgi:plastocyanin
MLRLPLLTLFCLSGFAASATIHNIEVGGNPSTPSNLPYYDPQFITIQAGDTVQWNWVLGKHSVTTTIAPESFDSGEQDSPFFFEFVFTALGDYNYECTVGTHAQWQFGTITVADGPTGLDVLPAGAVRVWPNPLVERLHVRMESAQLPAMFELVEVSTGRVMRQQELQDGETVIPVEDLPVGTYVFRVTSEEGRLERSLVKF